MRFGLFHFLERCATAMSTRIALIIAALMISTASAQTAAPTGASLAFTSNDPTLAEINKIISAGGFPSKEQIAKLDQPSDDLQTRQARQEMKEILKRMREEYGLTSPQL